MLKKSASVHETWRVTREMCEKGATWADASHLVWPVSLVPPVSHDYPARCYPVVADVQAIEVPLSGRFSYSATRFLKSVTCLL
jgi:hypothetical protein